MRGTALLSAILMIVAATAADADPICTDRPGKATSPCLVPAGHWQIETSLADWSAQNDGADRETSVAIGETTVKYGLTGSTNIAVDVTPWQAVTSRGGGAHHRTSGVGDVNLLLKQRLTRAEAAVQVAILPTVKLPTARRPLGNGKWEGALLVPISFAIGDTPFSIGLTPELDWSADSERRGHHAGMAQVAALDWQASERLNVSAEIWGAWDWDPEGTTRQASVDGTIAYLLNNDLQLDAGANFGLNRATPDVELYGGVSLRF